MVKVTPWLLCITACIAVTTLSYGICSQAGTQLEQPMGTILEVDGRTDLSVVTLTEQLVEDEGQLTLETALHSEGWQRTKTAALDIGSLQKPKWLRLVMRNSSESMLELRVDTGLPDLTSIDIWLLRSLSAPAEHLVNLRRNDPYSARQVAYRHIVGEFALASEESATVVLRVEHDNQRKMSLTLLSADAVASVESREAAFSSAFHAVMICMLLLTLASYRIAGLKLALSFAVYLISAQFMVLGWEQQLFRFVFAENRAFDMQFWAAMLNLMLAAQLQFGRLLFRLRRFAPRYDRVVFTLVVINFSYAILGLLTNATVFQALDPLEIPRMLSSVSLHFATAIFAWRKGLYGGRAFLLSGAFIVVSILLRAVGLLATESMLDLIRVLFVAESVAFIVALIQRTSGIAHERDTARLAEVDATRRELNTARALNISERAYSETRQLADQYATRLASVSHDLAQPLSALRLALERAEDENSGVSETLDYLEQLASGEKRVGDSADSTLPTLIDVRDITDRVAAMFEVEAQSAGNQFEYDANAGDFDAHVSTDGLALMRVLANLLSNAFLHSDANKVSMLLSRQSNQLHIEIADDGIGMDDARLAEVMESYGSTSTSLGLGIVRDNCRTQGYKLDFQSAMGKGTRTRVSLLCPLLHPHNTTG